MGGREHHLPVPPVPEPEEVLAEGGGAAGLLPRLQGLEGRQAQLLAAGRVHLLSDDGLDLPQGAMGQGKVGIDARRHLRDHARPEQQPVAGGLRLGGLLAKRLGEQTAHPHGAR